MGTAVQRWTVERRGNRCVAMAWSANIAEGPLEVRLFADLAAARGGIEETCAGRIRWREVQADEARHGVELAGDLLPP
jgi:hypothetical protein